MMDVTQIIQRHGQMLAERSTFEQHWQDVTRYVLPRADRFFGATPTQGDKRHGQVYDSTAELALGRFAAAMESITTPRAERWHRLVPQFPLEEDRDTKAWLEEVTKQLFRIRYAPDSAFPSQNNEFYLSIGSIGTGCMFVDDNPASRTIRYRTIHMGKICLAQDFQGRIDTVHRMDEMSARQLAQEFGVEKLSDKVRQTLERAPDQTFQMLHCVYPRKDVQWGRKDAAGMPWVSVYILPDEKHVLEEGGYHEFPYMIGRYVVGANETYGRSPAMSALPDIKAINEMEKTFLRAGQRAADPPLLTSDDQSLSGFQVRPGSLIPGGVDINGRPMVMPLESGANFPLTMEMSERRRRAVNDHFLVTLFQILAEDRSQMTATEVMQRAAEKGALLAPAAGRLQAEFLGPLIQRELGIVARAGALPPPPQSWVEMQGEYQVEYTSEIMRAQKAGEGIGILRTLEAITPLAQIDPTILDRVDPDEALRVIADVNGVPQKVLRSDEQVAALRGQRAQAEQAQQLLQAADVGSNAAKNMAQAQALQGVPNAPLLAGGV